MKNRMYFSRWSRGMLGSAALLLLAACSEQPSEESTSEDAERKSRPVITEEVIYGVERTFVEAVGTSRALNSVTLESAVTGEVTEINFSAGERVEKGQVLVRLDDRDERLALELAKVELADAERQFDRYERSVNSGGVTLSDLDDARSEVDRARIAVERAQVELNYHTIKAPFSGYLGITDIDPGAWIRPETAITTLDNRDTLLVRFQLPELLLGQLTPGQDIQLSTWNDRFSLVDGEIVDVSSQVDETRRTFTLRAHVDNANDSLRPGMSFRVQLSLSGNRYPRVPEVSLQWGGEGAYVWTVEDGEAKRVMVNLVQRQEDGVLVDAELPEGAPVITEGVHLVRAGMRVRPLNTELGDSKRPEASSSVERRGEES